ncbi:Dps family protein [Jeotgalibaca caeni]|uniref:Dps family protein n=1 Tax=Jeotgalibaca caeni TaxID=3028623 RepID=UPI00237E25B8|nr:DNA starvation/stationary phase protection protein [Jeotgalibaca caeni]MDE1549392.1 DNA starvation/stationary phase protection protein [Jeotgalibaca caeni]
MAHTEVQDYLNKLVATEGLFYIRLHQFHWYVKGSHFFVLHEKFEELYDRTTEELDEVAERLLAIGGEPYATLEEFKEHSVLEERVEDKKLSEGEMVEALVKDYETIRTFVGEGIKLTDEKEDVVSNDLLIEMKGNIDKTLWMLKAYLGDSATR